MRGIASLLTLFAAFGAIYTNGSPAVVYVSPTGSDANTGTLGSPWATIDHACARLAAAGTTQQATINLIAGTYLDTAMTVGTSCSGAGSDHQLTIKAKDGINTVDLVGGKQVDTSTCAVYSGSIYRCTISAAPWTVFEGGVRLQLARTPNLVFNATYPMAFEPLLRSSGGDYTTINYTPGDFDPTTWVVADLEVFHWTGPGTRQWFTGINPISSLNTAGHAIHFADNMKYAAGLNTGYVMEGDLAMVDVAGEFYVDRFYSHHNPGGGNFDLYLIPLATPISGETIYYPTHMDVLSITGTDEAHPVHDIIFDGIGVEVSDFVQRYRYATWGDLNPGNFDPAACVGHAAGDCGMAFEAVETNTQHGAVHLINAEDITLKRMHVKNSGLAGIYAQMHVQRVTVQDSLIEHTAFDGIQLEGGYCGEGDRNNNNIITDDKIQNVGELVGHGAGVRVANSGSNSLTHLDISQGPRNGIYVTDIETAGMYDCYAVNNSIRLNHLSYLAQDSGDMGAIGFFDLGSEPPYGPPVHAWRSNLVDQINIDHINAHPSMTDVAPSGVFTDNQTHGQVLSNINVTNTTGPGERENDSGDHVISNCSWVSISTGAMSPTIGLTAAYPY